MAKARSETEFGVGDVDGIESRLAMFLKPYKKLLTRVEQCEHAEVYVKGRLQQLPRRTVEPIATEQGNKRRPLQHFVGDVPHRDCERGLHTPEIAVDLSAEAGARAIDLT